MEVRERKSRDKNKGTRRGVVGMGYARIKIEKEKEWNDEYRMVEREITGKGQTVVTK